MVARSSYQRGWVEERKRRNGSVWLLRYRVRDASANGGWRIKTEILRNCQTKKAALRRLDDRLDEINRLNNGPGPTPPILFSDFVSGPWKLYLENKGVKPSTRYSYDSMLDNYLLPEFGSMQPDAITPMHLTGFFLKIRNAGLRPKYILNFYSLLRVMFEVAAEHDLIAATPVRRKLHRPRDKAKTKPVLSPEEIRKVIENISDAWKALFLVLALTGLRIGELLALRWKDADWASRKLHVTHSLWRGKLVSPKTEASARSLHLSDALFQVLLAHREQSALKEAEDFVFCRADGSPCDPDWLREKVLYRALEAAGIKRGHRSHGFHIFRHSAGSIVHSRTGSLKWRSNNWGTRGSRRRPTSTCTLQDRRRVGCGSAGSSLGGEQQPRVRRTRPVL